MKHEVIPVSLMRTVFSFGRKWVVDAMTVKSTYVPRHMILQDKLKASVPDQERDLQGPRKGHTPRCTARNETKAGRHTKACR